MKLYLDLGLRACSGAPRVPAGGLAGFTLLELLVVVALIGIMATLVTPSVSRMMESSMRSKSQSNLRQLHTFVTGYIADNNGDLPPSWNQTQHWLTEFQNAGYLPKLPSGNTKGLWLKADVLACPAMRKRDEKSNQSSATSYAMNSNIGRPAATVPNPNINLWKITQTTVPSKTFLLMSGVYKRGSSEWSSVHYHGSTEIQPPYKNDPALNDGEFDILYLDGHVESHKKSDMPPLIWRSPQDHPGNIAWRGGRPW